MEAVKLVKPQKRAFELSLRIRHPSMDPQAITQALAIEPEHCFRAGEPRNSRGGFGSAGIHADTYWLATLNPESWLFGISFAEQARIGLVQKHIDVAITKSLGLTLSICARRFRAMQSALLHQIRSEGGQVSLLVTLSPSVDHFSLSPEVTRVFGELGVTLEFEMTTD